MLFGFSFPSSKEKKSCQSYGPTLAKLSGSAHGFGSITQICNSYIMACPPVRGDNPQALASGLSYVQVDKHGMTILYHLYQHITSYFVLKLVKMSN